MIKPFQDAIPPLGRNGLASRKWVLRTMQQVADTINVTAEGIELSERGKGNLHLRSLSLGASQTLAFRLRRAGTGIAMDVGSFAMMDGAFVPVTFSSTSVPASGWLALVINYRVFFSAATYEGINLSYLSGAEVMSIGVSVVSSVINTPPDMPLGPGSNSSVGTAMVNLARFDAQGVWQQWVGPIRAMIRPDGRLDFTMG